MGCGASGGKSGEAEPAKEEVKAPALKVDPAKFKSAFKKGGFQGGSGSMAWLSDTQLLFISSDSLLEVLDVATMTATALESGYHSVAASADGKMYALTKGPEVVIKKADHSDVATIATQFEAVGAVAFSPDGKHLAVNAGYKGKIVKIFAMDGAEVGKVEGEKDGLDLPYWYDNETLFMASAWMLYAYSLAKKSQVKWELPTGSFNGTSFTILKSKKIVTGNDKGTAHFLTWDGTTFAVEKDVKFHPHSGPGNLQVFPDEQTVLYEKEGGGHFQVTTFERFWEKQVLARGECEEDDLPSVGSVLMNPAGTFVATAGFAGLEVFALGYADAAPAAPAV
mmetsp:Transcript_37199/g.88807  ORF Transcript_37199/g.88807 Transcript_37199/m.88807 type:complete len:337 (-) Transcript_37199:113-1123(-)